MMDGDAVREIIALAQQNAGAAVTFRGTANQLLSTRQLYVEPAPETVEALHLRSLDGVVDYLNDNPDELAPEKTFVVVRDPGIVAVFSALLARPYRHEYVLARAPNHVEGFVGHLQGLDVFTVGLQTRFEQNADRDALLKLLSNVAAGAEIRIKDDGVTQEITTVEGMKNWTPIPNPVLLKSRVTFTEIEQPEIPYVLRVRGNAGNISAQLIPASAAWMDEVVDAIQNYLDEAIEAEIAILR